MNLTAEEFQLLAQFIHQASGIFINEDKSYLVKQRLTPVLKAEKLSSFSELYQKLQRRDNFALRDRVLMSMTTHETSFFRDKHPFDAFSQSILPNLCQRVKKRKAVIPGRRGPKVDIWCAACSTGQEPYSLAMLISEYVERNWFTGVAVEDFRILATDFSTQVLVQAVEGRYNSVEIARGLGDRYRDKFFSKEGDYWYANESIRKMVTFQRLNLKDPFLNLGGFDVIFCRNVLIYFDEETQKKVIRQFHEIIVDDGFVVVGSSENLLVDKQIFKQERHLETVVHVPNKG